MESRSRDAGAWREDERERAGAPQGEGRVRELLSLLRDRNMALLLSGRLISSGGDWLYSIAIGIAIYRYSGSSFQVSLLWFCHLIPSMLLGPYTGGLADRIGYRRSMIIADLGRMVLVAILALTLSSRTYAIAFPLAVCLSSLGNLFRPASAGLIPAVVPSQEQRLAANAALGEVNSIAMITGSAVGGFIAGLGPVRPLLAIQAVSFGVSALSLWLIRLRSSAEVAGAEAAAASEASTEETGKSLLAGFRLVSQRPLLVFAAIIMAVPELGSGADLVWVVGYAIHILHAGNAGVGYLYAALGIGALVGGLVAAAIGSNIRLDQLLAGSIVVGGVALVVFGLLPVAVVALVCMAIVGLSESVEIAAYDTLLQQSVPANMVGRAAGTMDTFFYNMIIVGTLGSGLLTIWPGLQASIVGIGALTVLLAGAGWWYLQRATARQPDLETLAGVPAFSQVPIPVREWALRRMVREQFSPGTVVIRQGDAGDTFYTIAGGKAQVEVAANGRTMTHELGPGDFFGEIALLQNVPRTATVRALDELTVYALSREDFQELQNRASEFTESLREVARTRLARDTNLRISISSRA